MKYVLTALAIAALLVPATALAGGNPDVKGFMTFVDAPVDNGDIVNRADPDAYTQASAYIGFTDLGMGLTSASFALEVSPGTSLSTTFTNLLDLAIGAWDTGITVTSTSCKNVDSDGGRQYVDPVLVGRLDVFYSGTPGNVLWVEHPDYPRWITDCNSPAQLDYFCIWTSGGIGQDPPAGECTASTPVETVTWGSIKALYQ